MTSHPTPPTRIERRRALVKTDFVDATYAIIEKHGFEGFTLGLVADEVGLRKQAIYHYFPSKEAVLFEVALAELTRSSRAVAEAVDKVESGADAIEALLRTYFNAYTDRIRLFQLSHTALPFFDFKKMMTAENLVRLRPLNDLVLAGAAKRLHADSKGAMTLAEARRLAFVAQTSVVGLLSMKALVESAEDPLVHQDTHMIDTLVSVYRKSIAMKPDSQGARKK
ncbi:MAG: TetR/AcrR family transcriptional regulator [Burkholderiaceae bacterium]